MDWIKVITHPLGFAAYALFLFFGVAGAKLKDRQRPWFLPAAWFLAAIALIGGLCLAYHQVATREEASQRKTRAVSTQPPKQPSKTQSTPAGIPGRPVSTTVHQETHGPGSPAVQGARDVTITIDHTGRSEK